MATAKSSQQSKDNASVEKTSMFRRMVQKLKKGSTEDDLEVGTKNKIKTSQRGSTEPSLRDGKKERVLKKSRELKVACWNVRTMQDREESDRPQRRSALVARELAKLDIDIAAISEVRFADQGSLTEHGAGYTLYWSGKGKDERRQSGVGFMIENSIANKLQNLPVGHSDRLMSLRLPLQDNQFATLISVYAPTLQADPGTKEVFYSELRSLLASVNEADKILVLGDFNARVGRDNEVWPGVLGRHGVGNCNDNGRLLLELCAERGLSITNTLFQQKARFKTTWRHPRSKHWHLLDYILVRQRDISDVLHTRVMPSADCFIDHRLVRAKLRLSIKPPVKRKGPQMKRVQVDRLLGLREEFQSKLDVRLNSNKGQWQKEDPESQWKQLKAALQETAAEVAGYSSRKNRDWFDENDPAIDALLQTKRSCHQRTLSKPDDPAAKVAYREACSTLQRKLREMQNNWWVNMAEKTQHFADIGNVRAFYEALRAIYGPTHRIQAPLRSADGSQLLTDKPAILHRWSEHYGNLFGDRRQVQEESIMRIPQHEVRVELDNTPTQEEVKTAISKLKCHKAPGVDGIPAEVYKVGGDALLERLTGLFATCWEQGVVPQDLRDAVIVSLYKNKGEKSDCSNYRGVTLLSIAGKILARVVLDRLIPTIAEENLPESQCGFRAKRGTTDMIFVLRQIQEKCREQNMGLYAAFIDLTKAFDTVSRDGLWKILSRLGCPPKLLAILQQLHEGQKGQVKHSGDLSEPFPIDNGVKQGCVLAPTLFAIFFSMMLREAKEDLTEGIYIRFRTDGSIFNLRRLLARTKTLEELILDLLFADDCALLAHTEEALQTVVNHFAEACKAFGLTISLKKTEVMYQKPPRGTYTPPQISIDGQSLNAVEHFTYLGSVISNDATVTKDVDSRLGKACSSFGRLQKRVWKNHSLRLSTKIQVYRAVVITTLLYGAETWVLYRKQVRLLERFHQRCLRCIMGIKWQDYVTNIEVLERANLPSMEALLLSKQLRWAGHLSRMEDSRMPKAVFYSELCQGKRDRGAPRKRYKDQLKRQLSSAGIPVKEWENIANDRNAWRAATKRGAESFETARRESAAEKRSHRKAAAAQSAPTQGFTCPACSRVCGSRIGLHSHRRACRGGQPSQ
ncbi:Hypp3340 [Branchiostoma lanceolatum]|uniref:Hypp3340 protein n=1 Tax=Branchiostoma lanceolatum TaxID=7740 RepID=A0A8K0EU27_BRALA|nr:Hypp3340 [Branchiostoma lanceolatum]